MIPPSSATGVFPLPCVLPPRRTPSLSPRRRASFNRFRSLIGLTNSIILGLNCLFSGDLNPSVGHPIPFSAISDHSHFGLSVSQRRVLSALFSAARSYASREDLFRRGGRPPNLFCPQPRSPWAPRPHHPGLCRFLLSFYGAALPLNALPSVLPYTSSSPVPLVADRVALPRSPPSVDLLSVLPPHYADFYAEPANLLLPPDSSRPRPRLAPPPPIQEYVALLRRLLQLDMVRLAPTARCVNSLFVVPKPDGFLRLIFDGRAVNSLMRPSPCVELPTPSDLASLLMEPRDRLEFSKIDVESFFHQLRAPAWLHEYFALPPVSPCLLGLPDGPLVFPLLLTVPMGWSHSVAVAQAALLNSLYKCPSLVPGDRIAPGADPFLDRCRHACYVDDSFSISVAGRSSIDFFPLARAALVDARLPPHPSKSVPTTTEPVPVIGISLDSSGTASPSVGLLPRLCASTLALIVSPEPVTGSFVSHLVGKWTWFFLLVRPALSVFSSVYRFVRARWSQPSLLWESVRRELLAAVAIAPLISVSLSSPVADLALCSDASDTGFGVTVAPFPSELRRDLLSVPAKLCARPDDVRRMFQVPTCLDGDARFVPPLVSSSVPPLDSPSPPFSFASSVSAAIRSVSSWLSAAPWSTAFCSRWRRPLPNIAMGEFFAVLSAVRWACSRPCLVGTRLPLFVDNFTVASALFKGRSSSHCLRPLLRRLAALLFAFRIRLLPFWIPSAANPADPPSRL